MTPAQRRAMRRLAVSCAQSRDWEPLAQWVEAYAERTRSSLDRPGREVEIELAFRPDGRLAPVDADAPTAADVWRPLGWWRRLMGVR